MKLKQDKHNANRGTKKGRELVKKSIEELGAGRSIVVDKNGVAIAGNKTLAAAEALGLEVQIVPTTGNKLVVVQRTDLDLEEPTGKARQLAYADNRAGEVGLDWDADVLREDIELGLDLSELGLDVDSNLLKRGVEHLDDPEEMGAIVKRTIEAIKSLDIKSLSDADLVYGLPGRKLNFILSFASALVTGSRIKRNSLMFAQPQRLSVAGANKSIRHFFEKIDTVSERAVALAVRESCDLGWFFRVSFPIGASRLPLDFPNEIARDYINEFCPIGGRVLDPCHGWGGRLIGFFLSHAGAYVGVDPAEQTADGVKMLGGLMDKIRDKKWSLKLSPFEEVKLSGQFDFAITSPPYFDIEKYDGENTSTNKFPQYGLWRDGFMQPMLEKVYKHLKPGGVFAVNFSEHKYPLLTDAKRIGAITGFELIGERPVMDSTQRTGVGGSKKKNGEHILLLEKQKAKK